MSEITPKALAAAFAEATPYIQRFQRRNIVIKYGGNAMEDEELKTAFALDVVFLKLVGMNPIVVHGGGPQIGDMLTKLNIPTRFVEGHRVTDSATMDVVQMVLGGLVNQQIVALIHAHGGQAVGLTGKDGAFIRATRKQITRNTSDLRAPEIIDIGHVGEVAKVDRQMIDTLFDSKYIPIIAPIGIGPDGESYNINADHVASAIARAVSAHKLVLLTNTPGVLDQSGQTISELRHDTIQQMIEIGDITEGMLPKVRCAIEAIEDQVQQVHIIDGREPHALIQELLTDAGIGTLILPD